MSERRRCRVLVLAESCNPAWTSVPLLGWRGAASLAEVVDVHLVTQIRNRDSIQSMAPPWPCTFIDTEDVAGPLYRLASRLRGGTNRSWTLNSLLASISYPVFERRAWNECADRLRAGEFDVVHRLTPVSPGFSGCFAARCARIGVPFVLGPINGGVPWPRGFETERSREGERLSQLRGLQRHCPGFRSVRRHASAIIVGSGVAMAELPAEHQSKAVLIPENAIYEREIVAEPREFSERPLRVGFVGRLVPLKGVSMLIEAFCRVEDRARGAITLEILGDGPERERLQGLASGRESVRFHGDVPRERVMAALREIDVFAFPSIREFGGGAVVEAMASGAVPIVVDYGGPRDLVPSHVGLKIPIASRETLVHRFAESLDRCLADRAWLSVASEAAIAHVREHLTWESKARAFVNVYRSVLNY